MPKIPVSRLVTLIIGLIVILGVGLWFLDSLNRLSWTLSYYSPILANLLLFLLVILIAVLIAAFVYYVLKIQSGEQRSRSRKRPNIKLPEKKSETASTTLEAVRKQVSQIQDEVSRQALLSKSREIEANLSRGEIQVVVFGTGSAGKTSLVNAVMGRMVGKVNAPMVTTTVGETYCLRLKGMERKILITDTPGILEAGVAGTEREQLARELATSADLLLFVVDNDLRRSEYQPLKALAEIGKRSLLVLNKTDLYTEEDTQAILAKLRERVRGFIPTNDVVAIAANPQEVELENGDVFRSEAEIVPLLRRMAAILRAEGEEIVADNNLLLSIR